MKHAAALLLAAALCPSPAGAWGERGHHAIARTAALRILHGAPDPGAPLQLALRDLFRAKALELGHLASIPDTAWRGEDALTKALNAPTHFSNSEHFTADFDSIPLDYGEARAKYQGKPSLLDGKPVDLFAAGTLYWRAGQFYDLMAADFAEAKAAEAGSPAFNAAVGRALLHGGLLAHFVGDAAMPYHNAADHDGRATGNGGIHSFYESAGPNTETPRLEADVFDALPAEAERFGLEAKFAAGTHPGVRLTRDLGKEAFGLIAELKRLDDALISKRSEGKVPAERVTADEAEPSFRPMTQRQLAAAAAVLARLWRGAWEQGGRPDLSKAKFWDYHHKPDFIVPAYDPEAVARAQAKAAAKAP